MNHLRRVNLSIILLLLCQTLQANVKNLYNQGRIAANYDQLIGQIQNGDRLIFSNGNEFTVKNILGHGKMNLIIETEEVPGKVLRIPLSQYSKTSINETIQATKELSEYKTDIISVDFAMPGEFVIHRKINGRIIDLHQFIKYRSQASLFRPNFFSMNYISNEDIQDIENSLFQFLEKFYLVSQFSDLNSGNLVYIFSEKKWLILDLMSGNKMANKTLDSFGYAQTFVAFGYFFGTQFIVHDPKHQWLEVRINHLNQNVLKLRNNYFSLIKCQNIFMKK